MTHGSQVGPIDPCKLIVTIEKQKFLLTRITFTGIYELA
jgi:hypothetical protein